MVVNSKRAVRQTVMTHLPEVAFAKAPVGSVGPLADCNLRGMDLVLNLFHPRTHKNFRPFSRTAGRSLPGVLQPVQRGAALVRVYVHGEYISIMAQVQLTHHLFGTAVLYKGTQTWLRCCCSHEAVGLSLQPRQPARPWRYPSDWAVIEVAQTHCNAAFAPVGVCAHGAGVAEGLRDQLLVLRAPTAPLAPRPEQHPACLTYTRLSVSCHECTVVLEQACILMSAVKKTYPHWIGCSLQVSGGMWKESAAPEDDSSAAFSWKAS